MKKSFFILAAIALFAASCTKTEVVSNDSQVSQRGIGFSAYTARPTKAAQTDVTTGNFNSFEVTAIGNGAVYFDNVTFTKNDEGVWASDPLYFWPAFPLTFCAYNTPTAYNTVTQITGFDREINTTTQTLEVAPALELAYQQDLVAACAEGKKESDATNTGNSLSLTFNHYLTQVIVKARNASSTYKVVVDGVKIANMAGHGTYTFSNNTMTAPEGIKNNKNSIDYTATFTAKTLTSDAQEVMTDAGTGKWYLIPQSVTPWKRVPTESAESATNEMKNTSHGTYLALKVKITSAGGSKVYPFSDGESAWMAVPVPAALKFEQGKKYNVTFDFFSATGGGAGYVDPENPGDLDGDDTGDNGKKIIGGAIKFSATVNPWTEENEIVISL